MKSIGQGKSKFSAVEYNYSGSNTYQSPASRPSHAFNPKQSFVVNPKPTHNAKTPNAPKPPFLAPSSISGQSPWPVQGHPGSAYAHKAPQTCNTGKQQGFNPWVLNNQGHQHGSQSPFTPNPLPNPASKGGQSRMSYPGLSKEGLNSAKRKLF